MRRLFLTAVLALLFVAAGFGLAAWYDLTRPGPLAEAKTLVYVASGGALAGLLAIADPVRATSPDAVARLRRLGLEVVLLTGDTRATAEAVGRSVGIRTIVAGVLPEGKVAEVRRLP